MGPEIAQRHQPDLMELDMELDDTELDSEVDSEGNPLLGFGKAALATRTPIIALGTERRQLSSLPTGQFVAKPYHFAPLLRKIEELLRH